ncbi:MAG: hypothetical protein ABL962_11045 [Fimbriimonadaceae bacterium]
MKRVSTLAIVLASSFALSACSQTNLSEKRALELVNERRARFDGNDGALRRIEVLRNRLPGGTQWLIDNGFAEGTPDNWHTINGAEKDRNPYSTAVAIPAQRFVVSVDGVVTEEKRATIRYSVSHAPVEPAYTLVCVQNPQAVIGIAGCSEPPSTGTFHAIRQDDGKWELAGG